MARPLADRLRPEKIEDVVGQKHLLDEGKILYKILKSGYVPNLIFYGPSGVGKTTVANILSKDTNKKFYKLNATNCSVSDVKDIIKNIDTFEGVNGVLLYLDEIQNFNKKQQQSLLEVIENGMVTLIASTTENPYFYIYPALLSRCSVFEFKQIMPDEVKKALIRGKKVLEEEYGKIVEVSDEALEHFANMAYGDVRKALNGLELAFISKTTTEDVVNITLDDACECTQKSGMKYDKDGDSHYDILSAFQKSIRGSDPDAAIHYLARLVAAEDLQSICRRILVIAAEDVGLAYPMAISVCKACCDSALQLGFPEARIPLAEAVLLLANAPKSNSAICAIDEALSDINNTDVGDIPMHLKDAHYGGASKMGRGLTYLYPHSYPDSYVKQQYLPDNIKNRKYYTYGDNKTEKAYKEYWDKIKK